MRRDLLALAGIALAATLAFPSLASAAKKEKPDVVTAEASVTPRGGTATIPGAITATVEPHPSSGEVTILVRRTISEREKRSFLRQIRSSPDLLGGQYARASSATFYTIVILGGDPAPIEVRVAVPEDFGRAVPAGYHRDLVAETAVCIDDQSLTDYVSLKARVDPSSGELIATIPPEVFTGTPCDTTMIGERLQPASPGSPPRRPWTVALRLALKSDSAW